MVATSTATKPLSRGQHTVIFRQPQIELPSVEDLIQLRIQRLTSLSLAAESNLRRLTPYITDRNFQFFPEWPDPTDYKRWMALVSYHGQTGVNYLTPSAITDVVTIPKGLCVGLDVSDGYDRRNTTPLDSRANIKREGRIAFTVRMGVSFAGDNPMVIADYGMDLVGSKCRGAEMPSLYERGVRGVLGVTWDHYAHPRWGAPSCGSVVGLGD